MANQKPRLVVVKVAGAFGFGLSSKITIVLRIGDEERILSGEGKGLFTAAVNALAPFAQGSTVDHFRVCGKGAGGDADAAVWITVTKAGVQCEGHAYHPNMVNASVEAYVAALNEMRSAS